MHSVYEVRECVHSSKQWMQIAVITDDVLSIHTDSASYTRRQFCDLGVTQKISHCVKESACPCWSAQTLEMCRCGRCGVLQKSRIGGPGSPGSVVCALTNSTDERQCSPRGRRNLADALRLRVFALTQDFRPLKVTQSNPRGSGVEVCCGSWKRQQVV